MELVGLLLTMAAVACWSLSPPLVSRASQKDPELNAWAFTGWRLLLAALLTTPVAAVLEGFPWSTPWLDPLFEVGVWLGGVVGTVVGDSLFVYGVAALGACVAVPTSYLFVVWTGLIDYALGSQGSEVLAASLLSSVGVWLAYSGTEPRTRRTSGLAASVGASLMWTLSMFAYDWAVEASGPLSVAAARALFASAVLAPVMAKWRGVRRVAFEMASSSALAYVAGALAFLYALALMPPSVVGVGLALTPILTQLAAAWIASEEVKLRVVAGAALVAAGVALVYA